MTEVRASSLNLCEFSFIPSFAENLCEISSISTFISSWSSFQLRFHHIYRVAPKSKPLLRIIIKSYQKSPVRLHFSSILSKNEHKNVISVY